MEKNELLIEQWGVPCARGSSSLLESFDDKASGNLYIQGIFLQAETVNRNKRWYPRSVLENAVTKYIHEQVETHQALGELNHPARATPDPSNACIIIEKLWWEGNNVMGKARVIEGDKGAGDKLAALIRAGWIPGVSSRGLGRLKDSGRGYNIVQEGFVLTVGVDVVWGPSAPDAWVTPVVESTDSDSSASDAPESDKTEKVTNPTTEQQNIVESNNSAFMALAEALSKRYK
nr:MAG TPA: Prohead core protein serine protease [Caudoviricetes sp.]